MKTLIYIIAITNSSFFAISHACVVPNQVLTHMTD